jgi:hypothetical protein
MATPQPCHHRWIVDSIEESMASVEVDGKTMMTLPVAMLPAGVRQGDILRVTIEADEAATKKAYRDSQAQVRKTAGRQPGDPGGDITL